MVEITLSTRLDDGSAPYDAVHFICVPARRSLAAAPERLRGPRWGAHAPVPLSTEGVLTGTQGALACWADASRRHSAKVILVHKPLSGARVGAEPRRSLQRICVCAEHGRDAAPKNTSTVRTRRCRLYRAERVGATLQRRADLDVLPLQRAALNAGTSAEISRVLTQMWRG